MELEEEEGESVHFECEAQPPLLMLFLGLDSFFFVFYYFLALFFFYWIIIDLHHYISFTCTIEWFEIFLHEERMTVSGYLLSPHKIIIMLYITSLWVICFVTGSMYPLITFAYFACPPQPVGNHHFRPLYLCLLMFSFLCSFALLLDSTCK